MAKSPLQLLKDKAADKLKNPPPASNDHDYNELGEWWGECPYCEAMAWLGYKDHCRDCLHGRGRA